MGATVSKSTQQLSDILVSLIEDDRQLGKPPIQPVTYQKYLKEIESLLSRAVALADINYPLGKLYTKGKGIIGKLLEQQDNITPFHLVKILGNPEVLSLVLKYTKPNELCNIDPCSAFSYWVSSKAEWLKQPNSKIAQDRIKRYDTLIEMSIDFMIENKVDIFVPCKKSKTITSNPLQNSLLMEVVRVDMQEQNRYATTILILNKYKAANLELNMSWLRTAAASLPVFNAFVSPLLKSMTESDPGNDSSSSTTTSSADAASSSSSTTTSTADAASSSSSTTTSSADAASSSSSSTTTSSADAASSSSSSTTTSSVDAPGSSVDLYSGMIDNSILPVDRYFYPKIRAMIGVARKWDLKRHVSLEFSKNNRLKILTEYFAFYMGILTNQTGPLENESQLFTLKHKRVESIHSFIRHYRAYLPFILEVLNNLDQMSEYESFVKVHQNKNGAIKDPFSPYHKTARSFVEKILYISGSHIDALLVVSKDDSSMYTNEAKTFCHVLHDYAKMARLLVVAYPEYADCVRDAKYLSALCKYYLYKNALAVGNEVEAQYYKTKTLLFTYDAIKDSVQPDNSQFSTLFSQECLSLLVEHYTELRQWKKCRFALGFLNAVVESENSDCAFIGDAYIDAFSQVLSNFLDRQALDHAKDWIARFAFCQFNIQDGISSALVKKWDQEVNRFRQLEAQRNAAIRAAEAIKNSNDSTISDTLSDRLDSAVQRLEQLSLDKDAASQRQAFLSQASSTGEGSGSSAMTHQYPNKKDRHRAGRNSADEIHAKAPKGKSKLFVAQDDDDSHHSDDEATNVSELVKYVKAHIPEGYGHLTMVRWANGIIPDGSYFYVVQKEMLNEYESFKPTLAQRGMDKDLGVYFSKGIDPFGHRQNGTKLFKDGLRICRSTNDERLNGQLYKEFEWPAPGGSTKGSNASSDDKGSSSKAPQKKGTTKHIIRLYVVGAVSDHKCLERRHNPASYSKH